MDVQERIKQTVTGNRVVLYMKGSAQMPQCGFSANAVQILKACGANDLVTVDVEGWELSVMRGLSMDRYKPKVVILENVFDDAAYRTFMAERGYWISGRVDFNEIYVRGDWCAPGSRMVPPREPQVKS